MWRYFVIGVLSLNIFSSLVYANGVTVSEIPGNTVIPIQQDEIRLLKEVVKVEEMVVNVVFTFENTTQKDVNIQMGFPFTKYTEPPIEYKNILGGNVDKSFVVKIDGKELPTIRKNVAENIKLKIGSEYEFMYVWSIAFKPKEVKVVECIYIAQWATDISYPSGSSFTYITKTGALWKDTIRQAEFYIKLDNHISKLLKQKKIKLEIKPKGYKIIDNQTVEWRFINWEPTEDLSIIIW